MKKFLYLLSLMILLSAGNCKKEEPSDDNGGEDQPQEEQLADASLNKVELPGIAINGQQVTIRGVIQNFSEVEITSMDITWKVDGGQAHTMSVSGLHLGHMGVYQFTHNTPYQAATGEHTISVSVSNVNGKDHDAQDANNIRNGHILVASQGVQRKVLYEEFTSSTCSPCANFNSNYFNSNYLGTNRNKITLIKYQMNWPGDGDPYYTNEGGTRRGYYGVNGVPTLYMDGKEGTHFNSAELQQDLDAEYQVPGIAELQAYYVIQPDSTVKVKVEVTPYVSGTFKLHVAVVEKTTTGNASTNGETEFHNVMMKMVPNASGTTINATDGSTETYRLTSSLSGTHVEEINDLEVVVFVQNDGDKSVLQSTTATLDASQIDF